MRFLCALKTAEPFRCDQVEEEIQNRLGKEFPNGGVCRAVGRKQKAKVDGMMDASMSGEIGFKVKTQVLLQPTMEDYMEKILKQIVRRLSRFCVNQPVVCFVGENIFFHSFQLITTSCCIESSVHQNTH